MPHYLGSEALHDFHEPYDGLTLQNIEWTGDDASLLRKWALKDFHEPYAGLTLQRRELLKWILQTSSLRSLYSLEAALHIKLTYHISTTMQLHEADPKQGGFDNPRWANPNGGWIVFLQT